MARRRRYNRKRRRGSFAFLYKLLAFVLICGAIGLALAMFFKIEDIEISGSSRYTNQQITAAAEVRARSTAAPLRRTRDSSDLRMLLNTLTRKSLKVCSNASMAGHLPVSFLLVKQEIIWLSI